VIHVSDADEFATIAHEHGLAKIGVMVEVPEIVSEIETLLDLVNFISIGTNDLSQYTLGKNRHGVGTDISDARDPKVMALINQTVEAAKARGIPVGVCGEAAADAESVELFVELGVDSLSVSPALVPALREQLARR
jgi:phosphotransferase system enzyme I (PtsI)